MAYYTTDEDERDEVLDNIQDPVDPATGLVMSGVTQRNGASGSNSNTAGQSKTNTTSSSTNSGTSTKTKTFSPELYEQNIAAASFMPVPEAYTPNPYDPDGTRAKSFRDVMAREEERRNRQAQTYLNEGDRLRRKGRYLAWADFLNSLGQIAGRGYAPTKEINNSRTLKAFDDLDKMRLAAEQIKNDDSLNWIEKLQLQDRMKHEATEQALAAQTLKARQAAEKYNAEVRNKARRDSYVEQKDYNGQRNTVSNSVTDYVNQTSKTGWSNGTTTNFVNPAYISLKANATAQARANTPITFIGANRGHDTAISSAEANNVAEAVNRAILNPEALQRDANGNYLVNLGMGNVVFSPEQMASMSENLGVLSKRIMADVYDNDYTKANDLAALMQGVDAVSGYTLSDYYRNNGMLMRQPVVTAATPVSSPVSAPAATPAATHPTTPTTPAPTNPGAKYKRNK